MPHNRPIHIDDRRSATVAYLFICLYLSEQKNLHNGRMSILRPRNDNRMTHSTYIAATIDVNQIG